MFFNKIVTHYLKMINGLNSVNGGGSTPDCKSQIKSLWA